MDDKEQYLIPIEDAARDLGIEPKRLLGLIARNGLSDPIGDERYVYRWCVERMAADAASGVEK